MKVLLQFSPGVNPFEADMIRKRIVAELNEDGVANVPYYCKVHLVEKGAEVSNDDS